MTFVFSRYAPCRSRTGNKLVFSNSNNYTNHGREKDDLSLSGAYVRGGCGTEICEGGIRYKLGGPMGPNVTDEDVKYIVDCIKEAMGCEL